MKKEGSFTLIFIVMIGSLIIAALWDKLPKIKATIHYVLDPSAGALLNWNLVLGMLIIVFIISALITIIQKYTTDQKALKEMKAEQKEIQKQMKEFRNNPEKMMELQKRQMSFMPRQLKLGMGSIAYTSVPIILLFRWFYDYFTSIGNPKFFGFLGWIWFYLLSSLIFSIILKKWWDVA